MSLFTDYRAKLQGVPLHDPRCTPLLLGMASSLVAISRRGQPGSQGGRAATLLGPARGRPAADNVPPTSPRRRPTYDCWRRPSAPDRRRPTRSKRSDENDPATIQRPYAADLSLLPRDAILSLRGRPTPTPSHPSPLATRTLTSSSCRDCCR